MVEQRKSLRSHKRSY